MVSRSICWVSSDARRCESPPSSLAPNPLPDPKIIIGSISKTEILIGFLLSQSLGRWRGWERSRSGASPISLELSTSSARASRTLRRISIALLAWRRSLTPEKVMRLLFSDPRSSSMLWRNWRQFHQNFVKISSCYE